ncbi:MAG: ABC transporter permease subunit [Clostridiales bacterium]|nr:ABC transporter permease subunit [Clostridiales bacterium]
MSKVQPTKKVLLTAGAALFWLLVWQALSLKINNRILLVSPVTVLGRLFELLQTAGFWRAVAFTVGRILLGFLSACTAAVLLAAVSAKSAALRGLLRPLLGTVQATPVASFVILALLWFSSRNLSVLISFLMVFPIVYANCLQGILSVDRGLLEMARVFRIGPLRRLLYIYLPDVLPYLLSALSVSLGLCWKSGVAAEVIGIPVGSIGELLYQAKVHLDTADLLAVTLVIILVSLSFEKLFLWLAYRLQRRLEGTVRV